MDIKPCDFKLQAHLAAPCDGMSNSGLKNTAYIMNYDDVDFDNIEYDTQNHNLITKFALKRGQAFQAYVPGSTPYTGTNKALATGTYRNKFTKHINLIILNNGAEVANKIIDPLANGRYVVIMENSFQGANKDNTFEFYGLEQGLAATEMSDDKYSEDTDGGWSVALEEANAPTSGIYYLKPSLDQKSSVEVTREAIEALLTPVSSS